MEQEKAIKTLKQYAKFFAGRGKKYLANIPNFNPDELVEAMKFAENHLSYRIPPKDFIAVVSMAEIGAKSLKPEDHYTFRTTSLKAAKSVCRRLEKRGLN